MSSDPNKKSARTFQCRDVLWDTFEQMARELECSVDYLINEAMKQYARQRSYGSRTPFPGGPAARTPTDGQQPVAPQGGFLAPPTPPPPAGMRGAGAPLPPPPTSGRGGMGPASGLGGPPPHGGRVPGSMPVPPPPPPRGGQLGMPTPPPRGQAHGGLGMPPPPRSAPPGGPRSVPPPLPRGVSGMPPPSMGGLQGNNGAYGVPAPGAALNVIYQGEKVSITKDRFVIGRGKQSSDLTLKDPNVSRQHAMIEFQNGVYFMVDMGSTNGVEYNGQRIARKQIAEGDVFRICDHDLFFTYR